MIYVKLLICVWHIANAQQVFKTVIKQLNVCLTYLILLFMGETVLEKYLMFSN